jgi:hypothetical protein
VLLLRQPFLRGHSQWDKDSYLAMCRRMVFEAALLNRIRILTLSHLIAGWRKDAAYDEPT